MCSQLSVAGDSEADDTAADREGCRDLPAGGDDAAGAPTDRPNAHVLSGAGGRLLASSKLALKNEIIRLNQLVGSFGKYKERICQVRQAVSGECPQPRDGQPILRVHGRVAQW